MIFKKATVDIYIKYSRPAIFLCAFSNYLQSLKLSGSKAKCRFLSEHLQYVTLKWEWGVLGSLSHYTADLLHELQRNLSEPQNLAFHHHLIFLSRQNILKIDLNLNLDFQNFIFCFYFPWPLNWNYSHYKIVKEVYRMLHSFKVKMFLMELINSCIFF